MKVPRLKTFCPYCANETPKVRINTLNRDPRAGIRCDNCSRKFALITRTLGNRKDYQVLMLDKNLPEIGIEKLHCPWDGHNVLAAISEPTVVDEDDDADGFETFFQCQKCASKFSIDLMPQAE